MERPKQRREEGFVVVVLLTLLVPMLLVVGAFSVAMTGRTNELVVEMDEERALMAAEAGVDHAIFEAQCMNPSLHGATFTRTLSTDLSFTSSLTHLKVDGLDNDGDSFVDEPDEDVYQVIVTGISRDTERRVAAYLGPTAPLVIEKTAIAIQNPNVELDLRGSSKVSGDDVDLSGTPTALPSMAGMSIEPPGTIADLDTELTGAERTMVEGAGAEPSLGLAATTVDLAVVVAQLQNVANLVLTSAGYPSYNFGNALTGDTNVAYREGNVKFTGNSQGAGILVVTGDLELQGTFEFVGIVIVLGNIINSSGTAKIYGSVIQGPSGGLVEAKGTLDVRYSSAAVELANEAAPKYVAFNGWQELSR